MAAPLVLLPNSVSDRILSYGSAWGVLNLKIDEGEGVLIVSGASKGTEYIYPADNAWLKSHYSRTLDEEPGRGVWYRVDPELFQMAAYAAPRAASLKTEVFREQVRAGWRTIPEGATALVLTVGEVESGQFRWLAWNVTRTEAALIDLEFVDESLGFLQPLLPDWPLERLADELITVVGIGSIGSAVCEALLYYGVKRLALVDRDRLEQRNFARHRVNRRELGRSKVTATSDYLSSINPSIVVEKFPVDVVTDTDVLRPLFARSALVIGCTDGVASRRVVNHVAVRSGTPLVLACVLEDGVLGELFRVFPYRTECLTCHRIRAIDQGLMVPEPGIDLGYETGQGHRPMTAVGGDLGLVGGMAAKLGVATLLEGSGDRGQRPRGNHAVIGLRRAVDLPKGFDPEYLGEIVWNETGPTIEQCPTCNEGPRN